jgi:hypothetical protein
MTVMVANPQGKVGPQTAPSVLQAAPAVVSIVAGQTVAASGVLGDAELELQPAEVPAATRPTTRPEKTTANERDTSKVIRLYLGRRCSHIPSPGKPSNAICATVL